MTTTVFTNGTILASYRADAAEHTAAAVEDGRVVAVGTDALALRRSADETVDLLGGVLAPAFGDGHAHPLQGGLEKLGPQVRTCASVAEIVACVKEWADAHPEQEWIYGGSYDATLAPDGMFDARWLDDAVPDRPVVLRAWDYHTVWVNSEALRRAAENAGIRKRVTTHALRHSFATDLIRGGTDIRTLQELLGHADVKTTEIYAHAAEIGNERGVRSPLDRMAGGGTD